MNHRLRCIGVGEGWPSSDRGHSSYLYELDSTCILVDCGEGVGRAYKGLGLSYDAIDALLLSHMHSDHVGSFSTLLQGMWLEGRRKPLEVLAPGGAISTLKSWLRHTYLFDELLGFELIWHPVPTTRFRTYGDVRVRGVRGTHLERLRKRFEPDNPRICFDSYSFLIEANGRRIVHSSDIGGVTDLAPVLDGRVDLLVCELSHLTEEALVESLRGKDVGQLVLMHLHRDQWAAQEALLERVGSALAPMRVSVAQQGEVISI